MKLSPIFIAATFMFFSCQSNDKKDKGNQNEMATVSPAVDSTNIRKVITDFYSWYVGNESRMHTYPLYQSINKNDAPPYKINWDAVEKYQSFLKDSVPQLGQAFNDNQKIFFQQIDSAFKKDINEEVPYGFDFDWFTNSQEESKYLLEQIQKPLSWNITRNGEDAIVEIKGEFEEKGVKKTNTVQVLRMKKENGQWKIAKTWSD